MIIATNCSRQLKLIKIIAESAIFAVYFSSYLAGQGVACGN